MNSSTTAVETLQDRGPAVLAVTAALLVISTIFVGLRLISRIGIVKKVTWDDHFIVLAWLLGFGFSVFLIWGVHVGLGRHEVDVTVANQEPLRRSEYAFSVLYNPVLMSTKTSILIFYLTLSKNQQVFRWATYATLFVVNAAGFALTLLNVLQCHPVGAVFQETPPATATCTDIVTLYLSSSPVNIITDLAILFLPMPILTGMRLPRKQKIILIITFSFGAFAAVVDVIRIAYLQSAFQIRLKEVGGQSSTASRISEQDDFSWYASLSFMWSAIEVHVGIICACVPSLKPLAKRILPGILRDTNDPHDTSQIQYDGTNNPQMSNLPACRLRSDFNGLNQVRELRPLEEEGDMGMMDFLTTPDMAHIATRTHTAATLTTLQTRTRSLTFFDFVNMKKPKPMVKMDNKESYFPLALVTILFFLWGFAYGLLDVLNSQFKLIVKMSNAESLGLHAAYFAAYFVGPVTFGRYVLKRWGFKASYIVGLCLYGCGTLIFWPSAVLTSFPAFLVSNFIVGLGLSTLEVAANPFIALCGPPEHAETRLNLSQGVQAIGSVVSPLLATKVLFKDVRDTTSLQDIQWAYLGIALFDVALALVFYYLPIPEVSDEDLEEVAENRHSIDGNILGRVPTVYVTLAFATFSQFCYVGGQEAVAGVIIPYATLVKPHSNLSPVDYETIGHTAFAAGRFLCALAGLFIKPRHVLLFLFVGLIISSTLAMNLTGYAGIAMVILILLFESGIFPMIYAISLRGLGKHTKTGAVLLTAATSGGAIFPVVMSPVTAHRGLRYSFCVVVAISAFGALFPLYLTIVPQAKRQVDPVHKNDSPILPNNELRNPRHRRRASRVLSVTLRRKRTSVPIAEHVEDEKEAWPD